MAPRKRGAIFLLVAKLPLHRANPDVFRLIDKPAKRGHRILDSELSIGWNGLSDDSMELLADYHEFSSHGRLGPVEARSLRAVTFGDQSLDFHRVCKHLRRFSRRFLDHRE